MATWTSFYINTDKTQAVVEQLAALANDLVISQDESFPKEIGEYQLLNTDWAPDYLAIGNTQSDWVTVVHNSFSKLEDWSILLSQQFSCRLIVTMAQSVSDYYYFALYDNGIKQREIEVCYSDDSERIDVGDKLDFEHRRPADNAGGDEDDPELFDFDSLEKYCHHFGLTIQSNYDGVKWTVLKGKSIRKEVSAYVKKYLVKKPWWKFW